MVSELSVCGQLALLLLGLWLCYAYPLSVGNMRRQGRERERENTTAHNLLGGHALCDPKQPYLFTVYRHLSGKDEAQTVQIQTIAVCLCGKEGQGTELENKVFQFLY